MLKYRKILFFVGLLNLFVNVLFSQTKRIEFERYSTEQGLSQSSVTCIVQDKLGFMWFGTWEGLNRFDGYGFKTYRPDLKDSNSISHGAILCLYVDSSGVLWIGTDGGGLNKYDEQHDRFIRYRHDPNNPKSISSDKVKSILEDSKGNFYIATNEGGLNIMYRDRGEFERIFYKNSNSTQNILSNNLWTLCEASNSLVYVGSFLDGISIFNLDKNILKTFQTNATGINNDNKNISNGVIRSIIEDKNQNIWIGTFHSGVSKFNFEKGIFQHFSNDLNNPNSISNNRVESILNDRNGNLWIGTFGGGLNVYNPNSESFTAYVNDKTNNRSISSDKIWCLYEDRGGIVWVGTSGGGVCKFNPNNKKFITYQNTEKEAPILPDNNIFALCDFENNVLVSTGKGIVEFDPLNSKFKTFEPFNGFVSRFERTSALSYYSPDKNLIIGYDGEGADIVELTNSQIINLSNSAFNNSNKTNVRTVFENNDVIIIGAYNAGVRFVHKRNKNQVLDLYEKGLINDLTILDIHEESEGKLWLATRSSGVILFDYISMKSKFYQNEANNLNSLSSNTAFCVFRDSKNKMWVGTNLGLNEYIKEKDKFVFYSKDNGLLSNIIYDISEDKNGILWLSTDNGLSSFNPIDKSIKNYTIEDGLPSNSFSINSSLRSGNLQIIGSNAGLVVFDPDSIKDNKKLPPIVITAFNIFNKPVPVGLFDSHRTILKKSINETDKIVLKYSENVFSFEFAALDFVSQNKNQYAYRMLGFDQDWNYTDYKRRFVTYTNLDPGKYVFIVKASNNDGLWNEEGKRIEIIIKPPFYRTWYFYTFISIVLGFLIYLYIIYRERKNIRIQEILKSEVNKAVIEVEKQKEEIVKKNNALIQQQESERLQIWHNEGILKLTDDLNKGKNNIELLSKTFLKYLVKYLDINQGAIFLLHEKGSEEPYFELVSCYAFSKEQLLNKKINVHHGVFESVYVTKMPQYFNDINDKYFYISSGLGANSASSVYIMPLVLDDIVLGVLELASFNEIEDFKQDFVKKASINYVSTLFVLQSSLKTDEMLLISREQSNMLASQEEELRQNIEEMQATQESMSFEEKKLLEKLNSLEEENKQLKNIINKNNS